MNRLLAIAAAVLILATCSQDAAWGQIPQYSTGPQTGAGGPTLRRSTRPVVSPYTGLLGSNVGAAGGMGYQYFTRVQPQINAARSLRTLGQSVNRLQAQAQSPYASAMSPDLLAQQGLQSGMTIGTTGHPVGYLSHTQYFGTNLASRSSGSGGAGSSPTTSRR